MYPVIFIAMKLLQIQLPWIDVPFYSADGFFKDGNHYMGIIYTGNQKSLFPDTVYCTTRGLFSPEKHSFINQFHGDDYLSGFEFSNGERKSMGGYLKRRYGHIIFDGGYQAISDTSYFKVVLSYRNNTLQMSALYSDTSRGISIATRFGGLSISTYKKLFWVSTPWFILGLNDTSSFVYSVIPVRAPVMLVHLYADRENNFYIAPLYLLSEHKSIYAVFSPTPSIGYKSANLSIEAGYNMEKRKPTLSGALNTRYIKISFITEGDTHWKIEGIGMFYFLNGNGSAGLNIKRKTNQYGIYAFSRFYGLKIYGGVETDSTLTIFNPQFGFSVNLED